MNKEPQANRPRRIYKEQNRLQAATNPALTATRMKPRKTKNKRKKLGRTRNTIVKTMVDNNPVHPCIAQYISALVDPRNTPQGACVPWGFPTPSMRVKVSGRGTFQLGTTGKGFCYMSTNISNDAASTVTTTVTSVGTNATAANAFTNRTNNLFSKLPFTSAQLNSTVSGRFVAGGIRIRYAGTEANRNGIITCYESSTNVAAAQAYDAYGGDINARNERPPPDGSWHSVYYSGPYNSTMVNLSSATYWGGNAPLIIYVQGIAADLYEWEGYGHFEYTGDQVPGTSMSHSDPEGYAKVLEATKKATVTEPLSDNNSSSVFTDFFKNAGSSIWSYIKKEGMSTALETVSNYFLPGSGTVGRKLLLTYK